MAGAAVVILVPDLQDIERTAQSDAERRLARILALVSGQDAVAFYSVKLRSHAYKQMAEADFVVLWKGVAILVEVKGGGVKRFEGLWYTVDRHGDSHRLPTSPIEQARSAMFALRDILKEDGLKWFPSEAIAVTPDINDPPSSTEWKPSHWLARSSMTVSALASALDTIAGNAPTPPRGERIASSTELRKRLFGEFSRLPAVDAQRGTVLDEQDRATEGQSRVLAGLERNPRVFVLGGAGTGKSVVLAEAAKQEAAMGRSVLITFRSPGLHQFFEPRVVGREIDVISFEDLPSDAQYEVVLVDEAQDLMSAEAMDVLDRLVKGGRDNGRWRMFLDPNNQAQVDGRFDRDVFELVGAVALEYDLSLNVRNTKAIVHMVQEYLRADVGDPGIVNGERVNWYWTDEADPLAEALAIAKRLITEGIPTRDIWAINVGADSALDYSDSDGVRVLSPRAAKGLECEHVVVFGLPEVFDDQGVANFYVAVTRARVSLHVVASAADKKRLQRLARSDGDPA